MLWFKAYLIFNLICLCILMLISDKPPVQEDW